jgi:hypothetical protein
MIVHRKSCPATFISWFPLGALAANPKADRT